MLEAGTSPSTGRRGTRPPRRGTATPSRPPRVVVWAGLLLLAGVFLTSCATEPDVPVRVATDAAEYVLATKCCNQGSEFYELSLRVEITNPGRHTVYLPRLCGSGGSPWVRVVRAGLDETRTILGQHYVCLLAGRVEPPIPLPPGGTFVHEAVLTSFGWADVPEIYEDGGPHLRPDWRDVLMTLRTGEFRLIYDIRQVRPFGRQELLPVEERRSNVFQVHPPS